MSVDLSTATLPPPPPPPPPPLHHSADHLCYVHCSRCDTVLGVSVPCTSLFTTVTVRCGHCTYLLPVTMFGLMPPPPAVNQFQFGQSFFSPGHQVDDHLIPFGSSNFVMNQNLSNDVPETAHGGFSDLPKPPMINRPPEKRQRIPSAYNRFIKEEIKRIKARNPDISHREAFSAAAKNWAHFPHIRFGLVADKTTAAVKKTSMHQQEIERGFVKESLIDAANVGLSPYSY